MDSSPLAPDPELLLSHAGFAATDRVVVESEGFAIATLTGVASSRELVLHPSG